MNKVIERPSGRLRILTIFPEKGGAKQSFKKECDINNIVAQFHKTGDPTPFQSNSRAQWGIDAPTGLDFKTAMDTVAEANSMFAELPSRIRDRFENDPSKYLDFCHDPNNLPEMIELGLAIDPSPNEPAANQSSRMSNQNEPQAQPQGGAAEPQGEAPSASGGDQPTA